jgi:hypothetical protein
MLIPSCGKPPYLKIPDPSAFNQLTDILIFKRANLNAVISKRIMFHPMAYIGIGYSGETPGLLRSVVLTHESWLKGDRVPRFFGDSFVVLYDSNTAREFAKKCKEAAEENTIIVYSMERSAPLHESR